MRAAAIASLLLLPAVARAEGWQTLEGAPCPEFGAGRWLNADGERPTRRSLGGRVFLLVFFGGT